MSDAGTSFERDLTKLVRAEWAANPSLAPKNRRFAWLQRIEMLLATLGLPIGMVMLPLVVFGPVWALASPQVVREMPAGAVLGAPDVVLAAQALVLAALGGGVFAIGSRRIFCPPEYLSIAAFLPISDRQILNNQVKSYIVGWLTVGLMGTAPLVVLLWRLEVTPVQVAVLSALSILQIVYLACLAVLISTIARVSLFWTTFAAVTAVSFYLVAFTFAPLVINRYVTFESASAASQILLIVLPTGWVGGTMYYGVLQEGAAGWLFLLPTFIVSWLAFRWWRTGFEIKDVLVTNGGAEPVFAAGLPNSPSHTFRAEPAPSIDEQGFDVCDSDPSGDESTFDEPAALNRLKKSADLQPADWSSGGFIERVIGGWLTTQQRTLLILIYRGMPCWTISTMIMAVAGVVSLILILLGVVPPIFPLSGILLYVTFIGEESMNSRLQMPPQAHPIFPVGLRETQSALRVSLAMRAMFIVPWWAMLVFVQAWTHEDRWMYALTTMVVAVVQVVSLQMIGTRSNFDHGGRSFSWRRWVALGYLTVSATLAIPLVFYFHWALSLSLAAVSAFCVWQACQLFDYVYFHTERDYSAPHAMAARRPVRRSDSIW